MKLIVGLGNPGLKYKNTRHNIGFMFVDRVVEDLGGSFKINSKLKSQICIMDINGTQVCFCKPITYMNLSGEAVLAITNYYNIDPSDILIIHDDLDLPTGKIRMREKGSHGGHIQDARQPFRQSYHSHQEPYLHGIRHLPQDS